MVADGNTLGGDVGVSVNAPVIALERTPERIERLCTELGLPLSPSEATQLVHWVITASH